MTLPIYVSLEKIDNRLVEAEGPLRRPVAAGRHRSRRVIGAVIGADGLRPSYAVV